MLQDSWPVGPPSQGNLRGAIVSTYSRLPLAEHIHMMDVRDFRDHACELKHHVGCHHGILSGVAAHPKFQAVMHNAIGLFEACDWTRRGGTDVLSEAAFSVGSDEIGDPMSTSIKTFNFCARITSRLFCLLLFSNGLMKHLSTKAPHQSSLANYKRGAES
eukprot:4901207-Amphidinium_carterae.1